MSSPTWFDTEEEREFAALLDNALRRDSSRWKYTISIQEYFTVIGCQTVHHEQVRRLFDWYLTGQKDHYRHLLWNRQCDVLNVYRNRYHDYDGITIYFNRHEKFHISHDEMVWFLEFWDRGKRSWS